MTQLIQVPKDGPEVKVMGEARRGGLKYRMMIYADGGPSRFEPDENWSGLE